MVRFTKLPMDEGIVPFRSLKLRNLVENGREILQYSNKEGESQRIEKGARKRIDLQVLEIRRITN